MRNYFYTILHSLCFVMMLGVSMSAWAQDEDEPSAPTFTTDLESDYSFVYGEEPSLDIEVDDEDATYQWYESSDETADIENDKELEDWTSNSFTPESTGLSYTTYIYCVATNDAGSTTSTVAKVNYTAPWVDVFSSEEGEGEGTEESPYLINNSNWEKFIEGWDACYPTDSAYFKLNEDINTETAPESQIYLDDIDFDFNGHTISYTVPCPDQDHQALFFDSDDAEANVSYTYTIESEEDLSNFVTYFTSDEYPENVTFKLLDDIKYTGEISSSSNVTSFDFNEHKITYTSACPYSHTPLFADAELDEEGVTYAYTISADDWSNFGSLCDGITEAGEDIPSNVKFNLTANVTETSIPENPYPVTSDNFTVEDGCSITYGDFTALPTDDDGNICASPLVFNDADLQHYVKYNYKVMDDDYDDNFIKWSDFVTFVKSENLGVSDCFTLVTDILLTVAPEQSIVPSAITSTNFTKDTYNVYVSKGTSLDFADTFDCPTNPAPVFADSELDESVAKYCYKISNATQLLAFAKNKCLQKKNTKIYIMGEFVSKGTETDYAKRCGDTKYYTTTGKEYDVHEELFDYPLEESCQVQIIGWSEKDSKYESEQGDGDIAAATITLPYDGSPSVMTEGPYNLLFTKYPIYGAVNYWWKKGAAAAEDPIEEVTDPIAKQLLYAMYEKVAGSLHVLSGKSLNVEEGGAGAGTEDDPYRIMNYNTLKAFITYINDNAVATEDMYVKLLFDVHAQGWNRLTDADGKLLLDSPAESAQFTTFKGHFDGNNHTIGGLTRPLFAKLDGAEIKNLGIVDCNMGDDPTLAVTASNGATVTHCYVSGVSAGLAPSGATVSNCYVYNTSTKEQTASDDFSNTTEDLSGTHNIFSDFCYTLYKNSATGTAVYSDGTLFTPTDNTMYYYDSPSKYVLQEGDTPTNISATCNNWYNSLDWSILEPKVYFKDASSDSWRCNVDNPTVDNVALLHNVYAEGCVSLDNSIRKLYNLYSWYIVDKQELTDYNTSCRIKNIYYTGRTFDGLNTIYMPFPWNPVKDVYEVGSDTPIGEDVMVYILADKIDDDGKFVDYYGSSETYYDYSSANVLNFVCPSNSSFEGASNFLPAIVSIPSGKTNWCIKRHFDIWAPYSSDSKMSSNDTYHNLYYDAEVNKSVTFWSYKTNYDNRSFVDVGTLYSLHDYQQGRVVHCGTITNVAKGTFGSDGSYTAAGHPFTCYKLNSAGTGFARTTANSSVQPFRTLFALYTGGDSSAKKSFGMGFVDDVEDDILTKVDGVSADGIQLMTAEQSKIYSLDGRCVGQYGTKLAPGIYVMNGKKCVVK